MVNSRRQYQANNNALQNYNFDYERQVANLVNQERSKVGLPPLSFSEDISYVARAKSLDMRDNRYFDHQSPVFESPFDMMAQFGIRFRGGAENIARGQRTPREVMNAWMSSEGHRMNILDPSFSEIGVGYISGDRGRSYWTQLFVNR